MRIWEDVPGKVKIVLPVWICSSGRQRPVGPNGQAPALRKEM
ncbi:hypothetical protein CLOLEP_03611 [[Clostridium] leptum DSM 753]|uniref:Uncharacterized protein n=1 Tax=[Clostridium] leptum DSM 753 TaxID=428125 RepID=A7VYD3_9FIRM|nr:hypothetical protein CLOLEP_03611 [[Clostridium] leptum DSM 753]